jgi:hypothetical protein
MRVAVKAVIIAVCLASLAFAGACGSKAATTTSAASAPAKTLTAKQQAEAYFKQLKPLARSDKRIENEIKKVPLASTQNGFSMAARLDNTLLPALKHDRDRLKAITPPARFRKAHALLEKGDDMGISELSFLRDGVQQAVFTHTLPDDWEARYRRYNTRWKRFERQTKAAWRAAAKRSGVKIPKLLLTEFVD